MQAPDDVRDELAAREATLHRPGPGATRRGFERLLDPAFFEIGASGARHARETALDALERRAREPASREPWSARDFACLELAPGAYLLTYELAQGARLTRRASIWRRHGAEWRLLFHQGTPAAAPGLTSRSPRGR